MVSPTHGNLTEKRNNNFHRQEGTPSPRKLDQNRRRDLEERFFEFVTPEIVKKSLKSCTEVTLGLTKNLFEYWKQKRRVCALLPSIVSDKNSFARGSEIEGSAWLKQACRFSLRGFAKVV